MTIPGVGRRGGQVLIAEVGLDMTVFPPAGHLASWAGICPGNNSSGGQRRPGRTRHGSRWLRIALTEAAQAPARTTGTSLAAHHAHIRGRRGTQKAIGATRHDILIAYYHIVRDKVPYQDLGPDWNNRRRSTEQQTGLDEFPYLLLGSRALPSIIQQALHPRPTGANPLADSSVALRVGHVVHGWDVVGHRTAPHRCAAGRGWSCGSHRWIITSPLSSGTCSIRVSPSWCRTGSRGTAPPDSRSPAAPPRHRRDEHQTAVRERRRLHA